MALFAHFTAAVSMIRGCFVQLTISFDEKASKKTWSLYLAENVGKIQNSLFRITPSGSAYQPSKIGFPEVLFGVWAEREFDNESVSSKAIKNFAIRFISFGRMVKFKMEG